MYSYNQKETVEIPGVRNDESVPAEFGTHQTEKIGRQRNREK